MSSPLAYNGLSLNCAGVLCFLDFEVPGVLNTVCGWADDEDAAAGSPPNLIFSFENLTLSTCGTRDDEGADDNGTLDEALDDEGCEYFDIVSSLSPPVSQCDPIETSSPLVG